MRNEQERKTTHTQRRYSIGISVRPMLFIPAKFDTEYLSQKTIINSK